MLNYLKHFGYPYIAFFLVVGLLIGYKELVLIPQSEENGTVLSATVSVFDNDEVSPEELVSSYQQNTKETILKLEELLDPQKAFSGNTVYATAVNEIEKDILDTKVPEAYRELHLEIFRITQSIMQISTKEQEPAVLTDIKSDIEKIKNQYAWF